MSNVEKLEAKYSPPNVNYWGDRCCRAEAEIERLRAALEAVRDWLGGSSRLHQTELKRIVENAISQQKRENP